ncbi:MAG: fimbria/pilus periplasmic chaperone [Terricaulis sp.]
MTTVNAAAIRVSPMLYDLEPMGPRAAMTVSVQNTNSTPVTFEVAVLRREIGLNGEDTQTPAEDDFAVFPPQGIVQPGATQAVRVQYVGAPNIDASRNYVIMFSELPVDLDGQERAGIRFVFSFGVSVSVIPRDARADIQVIEASRNGDQLQIRVRNNGRAVARLGDYTWELRNEGGARVALSGDPVREQIPQPLIQPGTERLVHFQVPPELRNGGAITASLRPPRT